MVATSHASGEINHNSIQVVVLAAGKGTRMRSSIPKVMHKLAGVPMLHHVLATAATLNPTQSVVVVGHQADVVQSETQQALPEGNQPTWVLQQEQLGTGHAVKTATDALFESNTPEGAVLVLYGDVPLISPETIAAAADAALNGKVGLVTAHFDDPAQLGRIVREDGVIKRIVEYKDASTAEKEICEINSGILAVPSAQLVEWLAAVKPNNAQGEYYLTDVIEMAVNAGVEVQGILAQNPDEVAGVNDRVQLSELERIYQHRKVELLMLQGATVADPARVDVRGNVTVGEDCFIDVNVVLEGDVVIEAGASIGPGSVVIDSTIGANSTVQANTVVEGATLKAGVSVGPFARIRPGSLLEDGVKIGNFVETKKAHLGKNSKASHLAYLGDASIGEECNIGAGAVTCNYDGINKHRTTIGDNVFVGTNATMVAPIEIESNAFVAAGSSVTVKVEEGDLAVGRAKQRNIKGWKRPDQRSS